MATSTNLQFVWECRNAVEHTLHFLALALSPRSVESTPCTPGEQICFSTLSRSPDQLMDRHEDVINLIVQQSMATHVLRCKVLHIEATGLLDCQTSSVPFVRCQAYCWLNKKDMMEPTPNPMGNAADTPGTYNGTRFVAEHSYTIDGEIVLRGEQEELLQGVVIRDDMAQVREAIQTIDGISRCVVKCEVVKTLDGIGDRPDRRS
ncbi:hypothetical protein F5Y08DRAFT_337213 [Xylaria arbuscula]|nr:hypothetical protein F5Y08DRAFT_337213 [Xylaria arbuscula]